MPSALSIKHQQYYAHPQNAFWKIIATVLSAKLPEEYARRTQLLQHNGIALWDVLKHCKRTGSLDSAIEQNSEVANPVAPLLSQHPGIQTIFFNGNKAQELFQRHILPAAMDQLKTIHRVKLPSSSPAHARMTYQEKARLWRKYIAPALFS